MKTLEIFNRLDVQLLSLNFDSTKWPTVFVRKVKGKPHDFEAYLR